MALGLVKKIDFFILRLIAGHWRHKKIIFWEWRENVLLYTLYTRALALRFFPSFFSTTIWRQCPTVPDLAFRTTYQLTCACKGKTHLAESRQRCLFALPGRHRVEAFPDQFHFILPECHRSRESCSIWRKSAIFPFLQSYLKGSLHRTLIRVGV